MRVLIMGDGNSIHISNFIKVVLKEFDKTKITLLDFNQGEKTNIEAYNYYFKNNINVISDNRLEDLVENRVVRKLPKIRILSYLRKLDKKIKLLGRFDYCILHYIEIKKVILTLKNKSKFNRIVPVFWGSDILRNRQMNLNTYKNLFQNSHKIIFNTENMYERFRFHYGNRFSSKSEIIKFPTVSFKIIDKIELHNTNDELRLKLNLPEEKIIVMCGHSGFKEEQHEHLIESISKCPQYILKRCYFIFPMTYGGHDLKKRQHHVISMLSENNIQGEVLCQYLDNEELLKFIFATDIYISVIKTDAFSAVMQENFYSGSYVVYGKWLKYYEIENSELLAMPINSIDEITQVLTKLIPNIEILKSKLSKNRELISEISSPKSIRYLWRQKVFY